MEMTGLLSTTGRPAFGAHTVKCRPQLIDHTERMRAMDRIRSWPLSLTVAGLVLPALMTALMKVGCGCCTRLMYSNHTHRYFELVFPHPPSDRKHVPRPGTGRARFGEVHGLVAGRSAPQAACGGQLLHCRRHWLETVELPACLSIMDIRRGVYRRRNPRRTRSSSVRFGC